MLLADRYDRFLLMKSMIFRRQTFTTKRIKNMLELYQNMEHIQE
jgi:hypothetical protein